MGSLVMHLCIGKKISEKLRESDKKEFLVGNLAPDLSKITNQSKYISHFLKKEVIGGSEREIPDIDKFLKKYRQRLNEPFVLGYLCHLLSDKLWFEDYIPNHVVSITEDKKQILLRDIDDYIPYEDFKELMYKDYAIINQYIYKLYKINLRRFDNMNIDNPAMDELEFDEIHKLIDKISDYMEYEENLYGGQDMDDEEVKDKEEVLNLLSNTEIVTYIEQAIELIDDEFQELDIK